MDRVDHWLREASRGMSPTLRWRSRFCSFRGWGRSGGSPRRRGHRQHPGSRGVGLFALARQVVETADGEGSLALLPLPSDLIDDNARGLTATAIAQSDLVVLRPSMLRWPRACRSHCPPPPCVIWRFGHPH